MHRDLLALIGRERPAALLPLGTRFVHAAIVLRERIEATTAVNVPDLDAYLAAYHKSRCMEECRNLGVPHPRVYSLEEARDLLAHPAGDRTLVVKPDHDAGGAQGVRYVRNPASLRAAVEQCEQRHGTAIVEEYIPGGAEAMATVVVLFDAASELVAAFTTRKIRQWPIEGGLTALSRSTADAELVRRVLPLFRRWRWRGAAEVELKRDPRDGLAKVIEVNPRFPAYLRFATACGLDLPGLALSLTLGERVGPVVYPGYEVGRLHCSPDAFARSLVRDLRRSRPRSRVLRDAVRELPGVLKSLGPMALDPAPAVGRLVTQLVSPERLKTSFAPSTGALESVPVER